MRQTITRFIDPDAELMLRACRDEAGAFEELVGRYWPRVYGRLLRQLGSRQDAEDCAQDVFLRAYRSRSTYRPRAKLATWLFHIAANVGRNALRTRRRKPAQSFAVGDDGAAESAVIDYRAEAASALERDEDVVAVRAAMAGLLSRQRVALELQFEDHSYVEIAARLRVTPKAAKSLLYRARNQLRQSLAGQYDPAA